MANTEDKDLDELLAELRDEIGRTETLDETEQESLRRLDADIRRLLERSGAEPHQAEPEMLEEWERSVDELELEHPTLTNLISQVLNALSNAGL